MNGGLEISEQTASTVLQFDILAGDRSASHQQFVESCKADDVLKELKWDLRTSYQHTSCVEIGWDATCSLIDIGINRTYMRFKPGSCEIRTPTLGAKVNFQEKKWENRHIWKVKHESELWNIFYHVFPSLCVLTCSRRGNLNYCSCLWHPMPR